MAESSKLNDFTNVVIKLGLIKEGDGVSFYRHVPCNILDLSDPNGTQAVEVLKKRAVLMFDGKNDDVKNVSLSMHRVELTYNDTDDDKVVILSDDDIISALNEYVKVGRVKILAKVSTSAGSAATKTTATCSSFPEAVPYVSVSTQAFVNGEPIPSVVPNQTDNSGFVPPPTQENPNFIPPSVHVFHGPSFTEFNSSNSHNPPSAHGIPGFAPFNMFNNHSSRSSAHPEFPPPMQGNPNFIPPSVHVFHGPSFTEFNSSNSRNPPSAHEIPGFAPFNMFNNHSSRSSAHPEFASSIANIINSAVKSATSAATKAAADMEEQAKKATDGAKN